FGLYPREAEVGGNGGVLQVIVHMRPAWKGPECGGFDFGIGFLQERVALRHDAIGDESGRDDEPCACGVPEIAAGLNRAWALQAVAQLRHVFGRYGTGCGSECRYTERSDGYDAQAVVRG